MGSAERRGEVRGRGGRVERRVKSNGAVGCGRERERKRTQDGERGDKCGGPGGSDQGAGVGEHEPQVPAGQVPDHLCLAGRDSWQTGCNWNANKEQEGCSWYGHISRTTIPQK